MTDSYAAQYLTALDVKEWETLDARSTTRLPRLECASAVWSGDNYAYELMRRFGLAESGGAVRASMVLYTTTEEGRPARECSRDSGRRPVRYRRASVD